jgi:hypothetical protein
MAVSGDSYINSGKNAYLVNLKYCEKYFLAKETLEYINSLGKIAYPIINVWVFLGIL